MKKKTLIMQWAVIVGSGALLGGCAKHNEMPPGTSMQTDDNGHYRMVVSNSYAYPAMGYQNSTQACINAAWFKYNTTSGPWPATTTTPPKPEEFH